MSDYKAPTSVKFILMINILLLISGLLNREISEVIGSIAVFVIIIVGIEILEAIDKLKKDNKQ